MWDIGPLALITFTTPCHRGLAEQRALLIDRHRGRVLVHGCTRGVLYAGLCCEECPAVGSAAKVARPQPDRDVLVMGAPGASSDGSS